MKIIIEIYHGNTIFHIYFLFICELKNKNNHYFSSFSVLLDNYFSKNLS
jgi:hypothetical protein